MPFIVQKPNYCGPAALAMVSAYYSQPVTQDAIAAAIYQPNIRGVLTTDLAGYATRIGFWARAYRGDLADLRQKLDAGVPLILHTRFGDRDHFLVAIALDRLRETVTVHTDTRASVEMNIDDLLRHWERSGRWTLLVCPPHKTCWRLSADEHNDLGVFLERGGEAVAAAGHYRLAADLAPRNAIFPFNLGNALLKQKLLAEAAAAFRRAADLDTGNADALNNLAWTWHELGANLDEAAALCRRAVVLGPSRRAYYLDTLGSVLAKKGKRTEAAAAFVQALAATTDRQAGLRDSIRQHLAALDAGKTIESKERGW